MYRTNPAAAADTARAPFDPAAPAIEHATPGYTARMEVEAKFSFRTARAFADWLGRDRLGPFALRHPRTQTVVDTYLDTPAFACLRAGYACRVRLHGGRVTATLKSLADLSGVAAPAVRSRDEAEVDLLVGFEQVPPQALHPARWPKSRARTLAQRFAAGEPLRRIAAIRQERHEREIRDGARLIGTLSLDRVLFDRGQPELFELEAELAPDGSEADLAAIVATLQSEPDFQPQARSKLARALEGLPGVPPLDGDEPAGKAPHGQPPADESAAAEEVAARLLAALVPEAATKPALATALRRLVRLRAGAGEPAPGDDTLFVAAAGVLRLAEGRAGHGRKALRRTIDDGTRARTLPAEAHGDGLRIAALAAAAERVSALEQKGYRLDAISSSERRTLLQLSGEPRGDAGDEGGHRNAAVLWRAAFGRRLRVRTGGRTRATAAGLRFDATLATTGRLLMAAQFERLCRFEAELQAEASAEAIHDARVAARRLRTILRLFRRAYPRRDVRAVETGLRRLDDALSGVRDLDVMQELLLERLGDGLQGDPDVLELQREWAAARQQAAAALASQLNGSPYRAWRERTAVFLAAGAASAAGEQRLYERAPALIWKQYGTVRAAARDLSGASLSELHELRKEVRRLRYLLEGLRELLGRHAGKLLTTAVGLQDALGALHDADRLHVELLRRAQRSHTTSAAGAEALNRLSELSDQIGAELPALRCAAEAAWPGLGGRGFRRRLGRAVAEL